MRGASWLLQNVKFVRRGGIYPARGTPRRRKPGGYGIRPYDRRRCPRLAGKRGPCIIAKVCRGRCSHRPGNPAPPQTPHVGADSISARPALPWPPPGGPWPLQTGANIAAPPDLPETQNLPVGAGFIPPANPAPPQTPRDDLRPKSRTCGPVGLRNAPAGAVRASSPTWVCNGRGDCISRVAAVFPRLRRAGVHAAAPLTIQNREHSRRRKHPM